MLHNSAAHRVAPNVDRRSDSVQEPIDGKDETDVVGRQANRLEDNDQGDETSAG